jgi:hypothetical protein
MFSIKQVRKHPFEVKPRYFKVEGRAGLKALGWRKLGGLGPSRRSVSLQSKGEGR